MFETRRTLIPLLSTVLVLSLVPTMYGASVPDPIIDLGFNESSGTTTANSGTAGGELTLSAPRPMWSSNVPPSGGSSSLDFGTEAGGYYAESLDVISELGGLERFTVTLWVNCTDSTEGSGGNRLVCWKTGQNGDGLDFVYLSNGGLHMAVNEWPDYPNDRATRSSEGMISTDASAGADNWRFIALTYDSTLASDHVTYYFGAPSEPAAKDVSCTYPEGGAVGTNIQVLTIGNFTGTDRGMTGRQFRGLIDEVKIFGEALTLEQIRSVQTGTKKGLASNPNPANDATDVSMDVGGVSWKPGEFANTHNVFWGTDFDDVNDATVADPLGTTVYAGLASDANSVSLGRLAYGTTYYWRVDEVNAPSQGGTIFKGDVWNFTVEPLAYPITNIGATASASEPDSGPENTVNGSGLNESDQHSVDPTDMWLTTGGGDPVWIQYEFDQVYKLHELWVWNYNVMFESVLGFGLKDVAIEYSADGTEWVSLGDVEFAKATATRTYTHNTTVSFGGVPAKFVRLNVNGGWGMLGQFGLSEVRFWQIPAHPREPKPADGATDVAVDTALDWRGGREAVSHEVYLGTDAGALELVEATAASSYTPTSLDLATTYYWQIVEVNEADEVPAWPGGVWSFTTQAFIVVDGFESYSDDIDAGTTIFDTWIDGWTNGTGSTVGYFDAPFAERTVVRSGRQAMPLFYDNTATATSEADRELSQDWSSNGIRSLSLSFHGAADNTGGRMYIKINGVKVPYDGDPAGLTRPAWQAWNIDLSTVGANLSNVTTLTIGIEGAGVSGVVYIDDIRLYPLAPEYVTPVEPSTDGLVAHYALNGDVRDGSGNGHHGVANGGPTYAAGVDGQAINFDGADDHVVIAGVGIAEGAPRTISGWAKARQVDVSAWTGVFGFTGPSGNGGHFDMECVGDTGTTTLGYYGLHRYGWEQDIIPIDLEWHHLAATFDGQTVAWYGDGLPMGSEAVAAADVIPPGQVHIGKREDNTNFFPGLVDEVRLYDRALSPAEMAGLAGLTGPIHKPF